MQTSGWSEQNPSAVTNRSVRVALPEPMPSRCPQLHFGTTKTIPVEPKLAPDEDSRVRRSLCEEELEVAVRRRRQRVRPAPNDGAEFLEDHLHGSRQQ